MKQPRKTTGTKPRTPSSAVEAPKARSRTNAEKRAAPSDSAPRQAFKPWTADPVPSVEIPAPRRRFVAPPGHVYHLNQPKSAMLAHLNGAVSELRSFKRYDEAFGELVPKAEELARLLETARDWSAVMRASVAWLDYVRPNEGMAWRAMLPSLRALKRAFALLLRSDARVATELPTLTAFLGLSKTIARRGVTTRRRRGTAASTSKPPTKSRDTEDGASVKAAKRAKRRRPR